MLDATCSGPACEDLDALIQDIQRTQLIKYINSCALGIYIYNFVLTFEREVTLMWNMKFGLGKVLYFWTRYYTLFAIIYFNAVLFLPQVSAHLCTSWARFHWISGILMSTVTEMTLGVRLYAMYDKSRRILVVVCTAILAGFIAGIAIAVIIMEGEEVTFSLICSSQNVPFWFKFYWAPAVFSEILLFGLALKKGIENRRSQEYKGSMDRLMTLLVKDSIIYFLVVFVFYVTGWLTWIIKGYLYIETASTPAVMIDGIMSQRLLVNIRERYLDTLGDDYDLSRIIRISQPQPVFISSRNSSEDDVS